MSLNGACFHANKNGFVDLESKSISNSSCSVRCLMNPLSLALVLPWSIVDWDLHLHSQYTLPSILTSLSFVELQRSNNDLHRLQIDIYNNLPRYGVLGICSRLYRGYHPLTASRPCNTESHRLTARPPRPHIRRVRYRSGRRRGKNCSPLRIP